MTDQEYRKAEYDAFGPWIIKISEATPLPPLFVPFFRDGEDSLMMVKLPRDIERRKANPDMDLYDFVIALYGDRVRILERTDGGVRDTTIAYADIEGVENYVDLLSARFSIFAGDRTLVVPYNAVSEPVVIDMMRIIRERYAGKEFPIIRSPYAEPDKIITEVIFVNLLNKARTGDEGFSIAAIQPSVKLRNERKEIGRRLLQAVTGKRLLGSVHLANGREALVVSRGKPFKTRQTVVYSHSYLYLPLERLRTAEFEADGRYANLTKLSLNTINHRFEFYVDEANAEARKYQGNLDAMLKRATAEANAAL